MGKYTLDNKIKYLIFSNGQQSLGMNKIGFVDNKDDIKFKDNDPSEIVIKIYISIDEKNIILSQGNMQRVEPYWSLIEPLRINSITTNCINKECNLSFFNKYKKGIWSKPLGQGIWDYDFEYTLHNELDEVNEKINKMEQQIEELNKFKNEVNEKHNELVNKLLDRIVELSNKN